MTPLSLRISKIITVLVFGQLMLSCSRTVGIANDSAPPDVNEDSREFVAADNPFLQRSDKPTGEACLSMFLQSSGDLSMVVSNECSFAVALLTSPLEVRVRRTGTESFVNERMNRAAAYAILYFVDAAPGAEGFQGDGVARDGGLQVLRPPGYTTVPARETIRVPLKCDVSVAEGRYFMPVMTYEAPQGGAPERSDPFDCRATVEHFNGKTQKSVDISLSEAARQVSSKSIAIDWRSK